MGAWFFLAAAITLAAPQGSGQAPAAADHYSGSRGCAGARRRRRSSGSSKKRTSSVTKGTKKGVTDSIHATLSDGKLTHDAHIQNIDETKREFRSNQGVEFDFRDSWTFNVAAYKIDRLIGLNMVPPSVSRNHRSKPAAWTWWLDDVLMDEGGQGQEQGRTAGSRLLQPSTGDDVPLRSAHLQHRSQPGQHRLHQGLAALADRSHARLPQEQRAQDAGSDHPLRPAGVRRSQGARSREAEGAKWDEYLDDGQIKSLLARRDAIVKKLEALGPNALFDRTVPVVTAPGSAAAVR